MRESSLRHRSPMTRPTTLPAEIELQVTLVSAGGPRSRRPGQPWRCAVPSKGAVQAAAAGQPWVSRGQGPPARTCRPAGARRSGKPKNLIKFRSPGPSTRMAGGPPRPTLSCPSSPNRSMEPDGPRYVGHRTSRPARGHCATIRAWRGGAGPRSVHPLPRPRPQPLLPDRARRA